MPINKLWMIQNFVQHTLEENKLPKAKALLMAEVFMEEEIAESLLDMKNRKAPGLDGYPMEFYQFHWKDVKKHFLEA